MIPKKIHYCWFGKGRLTDSAYKCIESWKKYCPDYEIIEWNEENFNVNICDYTKEAYENSKWAFVSDYARLWILYNEGGIYFDVDVELIKSIDDIVEEGSFMGFERNIYGVDQTIKNDFTGVGINPGIGLGAISGLPIFNELLEDYNHRHFIEKDGNMNTTSIVDYVTRKFVQKGLILESRKQRVEDIIFYPVDYFGPMNYLTGELIISENTRSIHRYSASWVEKSSKKRMKARYYFMKILGYRYGVKIYNVIKKILKK